MFRQAARGSLRSALKGRVYSTGHGLRRTSRKVPGILLASAFAATFALNSAVVYNDAPAEQVPEQKKKADAVSSVQMEHQDGLNTIVWGSNKCVLVSLIQKASLNSRIGRECSTRRRQMWILSAHLP